MKLFIAASAATGLLLALAAGAGAITNGAPDGTGHPEVGALLAQHAFSDGTWEELHRNAHRPAGVPHRGALR